MLYSLLNKKFTTNPQHLDVEMFWICCRPLQLLLHWLPVTYKLAVLTHKVRTTATPTYLSELVQTRAPPRALRSSDDPMLVVPRTHTELARCAFLLLLHPPGTLSLLTFDCAKTFSLSNATWIYSNSLSAASSASVSSDLKALYKSVVIIIIFLPSVSRIPRVFLSVIKYY